MTGAVPEQPLVEEPFETAPSSPPQEPTRNEPSRDHADDPTGDGHTLIRHADQLAVVRLPAGSDLPEWVVASTLLSITATQAETSIVCHASSVPAKATSQGPFVAYEVQGPLDFALTGVLHGILAPLAEADISVFTISTFDTDWVLLPANRVAKADEAWAAAGHTIQVAAEEPEGERADKPGRERKPGNPRRQGKNGPASTRGKGRDRGGRKKDS